MNSSPLPVSHVVEPTYPRWVFEAILKGFGEDGVSHPEYVCDDRGAWLKPAEKSEEPPWHPLLEIAPQASQPLHDTPWLPFPFTARQLATLMTDGWGDFVWSRFGDWEGGPNQRQPGCIGALNHTAKEALRTAFHEYRIAAHLAPRLKSAQAHLAADLEERIKSLSKAATDLEAAGQSSDSATGHDKRADQLRHLKKAIADLTQRLFDANRDAQGAHARWRKSVVQHLLLPVEALPVEALESDLLRSLSVDRRSEQILTQRANKAFELSEDGKREFQLISDVCGIDDELRTLALMRPNEFEAYRSWKAMTEDLRRKRSELEAQLADIDAGPLRQTVEAGASPESDQQRQTRRLADLRGFGGNWVRNSSRASGWGAKDRNSGAFGRLVKQEQSKNEKVPNSSEKSIRRDLDAAAEAEAAAARAGATVKALAGS